MPAEVKVSHNIELDAELTNDVLEIARKQGENPDTVCNNVQELRELIFGLYPKRFVE